MQRCIDQDGKENRSAGRFRVTLLTINEPEEFRQQLIGHPPVWVDAGLPTARVIDESPAVSNKEPWEGELCTHELNWLNTAVPGTTHPKNWAFKVEKLDK